MAAVDFVEVILEENPISENAVAVPATGPNRLSTDKLYMAGRSAGIKANRQDKDRSDEFRGVLGSIPKLVDGYAPDGALTEYAYFNDLTWLLSLAGFVGVPTAGGVNIADPDTTTATGVNALNSAIVNVGDTSLFPAAGAFVLGGVGTTYSGKTATSFTGCANHAATVGGEVISNNVPATCTKWVFSKKSGIVAPTAQIRVNYADELVQMKGNGYSVSQLSVSAAGELSASLLGMVCKRLAVDTTTVPTLTSQAIPPIRKSDLYLSFLSGGGAVEDFGWTIDNPLAAIRTMSLLPTSFYPDTMEFGDAQAKLTGTIPKRIAGGIDIDAVLALTTFAAKARYKSPKAIAATAYPFSMWVEMPSAQYTAGTVEDLKNARRHGMPDLAFEAAYDETAGYDARITLVNSVPSILTLV